MGVKASLYKNRGERYFRANWASKHASKQTRWFTSEFSHLSGRSADRFQDLRRQFGRVLTCKQSNRCNHWFNSLVGLGGPTQKNLWNGNRRRRSTLAVWLDDPSFGDDFRPKNCLFGFRCQMNADIKWKLGFAIGLFAFINAKSTI